MKKNIIYTGSSAYNIDFPERKPHTNQLAYVKSTQMNGVVLIEYSSILPGPFQYGDYNNTQSQKILLQAVATTSDWSGIAIMGKASTDDLYTGDLLYPKSTGGEMVWCLYNATATDQARPPRGMACCTINASKNGPILLRGTITAHNSKWNSTAWTANDDEGKTLYASTVSGGLSTAVPGTTGAAVFRVGFILQTEGAAPTYLSAIYFDPVAITALDYITT